MTYLTEVLRVVVPAGSGQPGPLAGAAIAAVLRHAHQGALPMFARTLGLSQSALLQMLAVCCPWMDYGLPVSERKYAVLAATAPVLFG